MPGSTGFTPLQFVFARRDQCGVTPRSGHGYFETALVSQKFYPAQCSKINATDSFNLKESAAEKLRLFPLKDAPLYVRDDME